MQCKPFQHRRIKSTEATMINMLRHSFIFINDLWCEMTSCCYCCCWMWFHERWRINHLQSISLRMQSHRRYPQSLCVLRGRKYFLYLFIVFALSCLIFSDGFFSSIWFLFSTIREKEIDFYLAISLANKKRDKHRDMNTRIGKRF